MSDIIVQVSDTSNTVIVQEDGSVVVNIIEQTPVVVEVGVQGPPGPSATAETMTIEPSGSIEATNVQDAFDEIGRTFTQSTTAPSNPSVADQWFDLTNNVLKIYKLDGWVPLADSNISINGGYF